MRDTKLGFRRPATGPAAGWAASGRTALTGSRTPQMYREIGLDDASRPSQPQAGLGPLKPQTRRCMELGGRDSWGCRGRAGREWGLGGGIRSTPGRSLGLQAVAVARPRAWSQEWFLYLEMSALEPPN